MELRKHVFDVGGILEAPDVQQHQTRASEDWIAEWEAQLRDVVGLNDAWGLLMERPDGEVFLFDCTPRGIRAAAEYGVRAGVMLLPPRVFERELQ
jgi:hypothetical protein